MKNKYAEIFIDALDNVLESFTTKKIIRSEISEPAVSGNICDITVMIGLEGDIQGEVYLTMNAQTGQILASEMFGGIEITQVDEMVISAVCELCNMVMGNACSNLCGINAVIDITPPTFAADKKLIFQKDSVNISCNLDPFGNIDLNLAV